MESYINFAAEKVYKKWLLSKIMSLLETQIQKWPHFIG